LNLYSVGFEILIIEDLNLNEPNKKKIHEVSKTKYVFGSTIKSREKNIEPIKIESQLNEKRFT
jgi:spore coat polysaccharide biosynthesis predicted glycosyltransferase SpsG